MTRFKNIEEALRNKIQELESRIENEYVLKSNYMEILAENENMVNIFKNELNEKEERFHSEIRQKQAFYEEKFNKDLELIQGNAQSKLKKKNLIDGYFN